MANLAEVLLAQTKQRRAVKFCVATDEIIRVRMKLLACAVAPRLFGVVPRFEVDGARAPVIFLAGPVIAPLEQQDLLAGGREAVGGCPPPRACSDDDYVVVIVAVHDAPRLVA